MSFFNRQVVCVIKQYSLFSTWSYGFWQSVSFDQDQSIPHSQAVMAKADIDPSELTFINFYWTLILFLKTHAMIIIFNSYLLEISLIVFDSQGLHFPLKSSISIFLWSPQFDRKHRDFVPLSIILSFFQGNTPRTIYGWEIWLDNDISIKKLKQWHSSHSSWTFYCPSSWYKMLCYCWRNLIILASYSRTPSWSS